MNLPVKFLLVGTLYGLCGMLLGIVMGAKENFTLMPVHAHLNLLGWVAITLYGLSYQVFPKMATSKLVGVHFYVVNAGVLILIPSLAALLLGYKIIIPALVLGELCTLASLFLFALILWKNRNN